MILNDILCFLSTSIDNLTTEEIISIAVGFYEPEKIKKAKEQIFNICNETAISRRATKNVPNVSVSDIQDILDLIVKMEGKNFTMPKFVAENYLSLPPTSGFLPLARMMSSFRDEIAALRTELSQLKETRENDLKSLEDISDVKQDVSDIKIMLRQKSQISTQNVNDLESNHTDADNNADDNPISHNRPTYAQAFLSRPAPFSGEQPTRRRDFSTANHNRDGMQRTQNNNYNKRYPLLAHANNRPHAQAHYQSRQAQHRQPQYRQQQQVKSPTNIVGSNETTDDELSSAPKILDVYVGGCNTSTTIEGLKNYCKRKFSFDHIECEQLKSRFDDRKSFKVSVRDFNRDTLLNSESWPTGIIVRKFFKARSYYSAYSQ